MKQKYYILLSILIIISLFIFAISLNTFNNYYRNFYSYSGFEISDWLINYQSGFIRRGLLGEILLQTYHIVPFNVKGFITIISVISFLVFCLLFKKSNNIGAFIPLFISFRIFSVMCFRRDFIIFCMAYCIFYIFLKHFKKFSLFNYITLNILLTLMILIHESSFFYVIPALIILTLFCDSSDTHVIPKSPFAKRDEKKSYIHRMLAVFSVPILAMIAVCLKKGTPGCASTIWHSWDNLFNKYVENGYDTETIGEGVEFLEHSMTSAFKFHLNKNFLFVDFSPSIESICPFLTFLLVLILTYYLTTRFFAIDTENKRVALNKQHKSISTILLIEFIAMLPMFTVLSCDYGRTITYCVVIALMLSGLMHRFNVSLEKDIPLVSSFSTMIQNKIDKTPILNSVWIYLLTLLIYPMKPYYFIEIKDNIIFFLYNKFILY